MTALLAIVVSLAAGFIAMRMTWRIDQLRLLCGTPYRAFCAASLAGLSVWMIVVILAALLLRIPGAYGPVQFWGGMPPFFHVRFVATLGLLVGCLLCGLTVLACLVSLFQKSEGRRPLRLICPAWSLCAFGIAACLFNQFDFAPSV